MPHTRRGLRPARNRSGSLFGLVAVLLAIDTSIVLAQDVVYAESDAGDAIG